MIITSLLLNGASNLNAGVGRYAARANRWASRCPGTDTSPTRPRNLRVSERWRNFWPNYRKKKNAHVSKAASVGCPIISSSPSPSWRGSDAIRVLLFSLTLRSGQAILQYYPRLLSSWPTSSTDAPRLWSIPEAVESSFPPKCSANLRAHSSSLSP